MEDGVESVGNAGASHQMENVKVAVRLRPFTEKEKQKKNKRIVEIEQNTIALKNPKNSSEPSKKFTFDHSYWSHDGFMKDSRGVNVSDPDHANGLKYVSQEQVFDDLGKFLLDNTLKGYNSALLAYGQTGSGKSYTVSGYGANEGILPRFARALYVKLDEKVARAEPSEPKPSPPANIAKPADMIDRYEVYFSMIEIYNEVVRDLLNSKPHDDALQVQSQSAPARRGLKIREHPLHGFFVEKLTSYICQNEADIEHKIEEGQLNKSIAATRMNEMSSRGHTIYEFKIRQYKTEAKSDETVISSVVQLIDLAGSERMAVHLANDETGAANSSIGSRSGTPTPITSGDSNRGASKSSSKRPKGTNSELALGSQASSSSSSSIKRSRSTTRAGSGAITGLQPEHQQRFKESVSINQSLSALGKCIQILSQYSQQLENGAAASNSKKLKIPYRDSALTKLLLRCCLSGNSKVVIIAALSPADVNFDDTLSTLRFADRAKQIRTHATVNEILDEDEVGETEHEMDETPKRTLASSRGKQTYSRTKRLQVVPERAQPDSRSPSQTPTRRVRRATNKQSGGSRLSSVMSISNPALAEAPRDDNDDQGSIVANRSTGSQLRKSRSSGHGLLLNDDQQVGPYEDDDYELRDDNNFIMSPESDESLTLLTDDDLSNEEKIEIFNRMLNQSMGTGQESSKRAGGARGGPKNKSSLATDSLKANNHSRRARPGHSMKQISLISSNLKKSNPFISNLNPDEQLTGVLNYIIKPGETTIGKDADCDIVLQGAEIRAKHAKIIRVDQTVDTGRLANVFIEPLPVPDDVTTSSSSGEPSETTRFALKVNGNPIVTRTQLDHCDRLLFGTNNYYVISNNHASESFTSADPPTTTVANPDLVTYDMAKSEVLTKVMMDDKNKQMVDKINNYVHRPGTGKASTQEIGPTDPIKSNVESNDQDTMYRNQLLEDTYEYVIPVAEVNAVASEMGVKVKYSLKILTGEEQLLEQPALGASESGSQSLADSSEIDNSKLSQSEESSANNLPASQQELLETVHIGKLDGLDIPPALFIKVHLEEYGFNFYWPKDKFQARRFRILELFSAWNENGKTGLVEGLIDQLRTQDAYLFDPFIDDPLTTFVLVGNAQVALQPLSQLRASQQNCEILDLDDEVVGSVSVQISPNYDDSDQSSSEASTSLSNQEPAELIGKKLAFSVKIISCRELPIKYHNIFCQIKLDQEHSLRTKIQPNEADTCNPGSEADRKGPAGDKSDDISETTTTNNTESEASADSDSRNQKETHNELNFDLKQNVHFEKVTPEIMEFLEFGFLNIQIIGQYRVERPSEPITIVSSIIDSINKYKFKMDQSLFGAKQPSYASSDFYQSSDSPGRAESGSSGLMPTASASNSGASSVASNSTTLTLFDQQNEYEESINGISQENVIDMILTKRKLDRAENQLVSIATNDSMSQMDQVINLNGASTI